MASIDLDVSFTAPDIVDEMSNGSDDDLEDGESAGDGNPALTTAIQDLEDLEEDEGDDAPPPAAQASAPASSSNQTKPASVRRKWTLLQKLRVI